MHYVIANNWLATHPLMKKKIIDTAWDMKKEYHLNKNNIIFQDKKYLKLYLRLKEVDQQIKKQRENNEV